MKKGSSHVDWAISLALFLLYLAWFFILIRPAYIGQGEDVSLSSIENRFLDQTSWTVQKIPLFVSSNNDDPAAPVMVTLPFSWNESNVTMDEAFSIYDNSLFFVPELSQGKNLFWIANSRHNYSHRTQARDIQSDSDIAIVAGKGFEVIFEKSLLQSLFYQQEDRILNASFTMSTTPLQDLNSSFQKSNILAIYSLKSEEVSHTSIVFAENSMMFTRISTIYDSGYYEIDLILDNFPYYFGNNNHFGSLNYSGSTCDDFDSDFLDFYSDQGGISFIFKSPAEISFCNTNVSTIELEISTEISGDEEYIILAHDGDYNDVLNYSLPEAQFGAFEKIKGISTEELESFKNENYLQFKSNIDYPENKDFNLQLLDKYDNQVFEYGLEPEISSNIFVKESQARILDEKGELNPLRLRIKGW